MHILLIANNCSLAWGGECALAYHWFAGLRRRDVRVSLLTHVRNRSHLRAEFGDDPTIRYVDDERLARRVWQIGSRLVPASKTQLSWATTGTVLRLMFELAARAVIRRWKLPPDTVLHRVSPIAPLWPFLFGGLGLPTIAGPLSALPELPRGFGSYAREHGFGVYRRLKPLGRLLSQALPPPTRILCANRYTQSCLPGPLRARCLLMPENGIDPDCFKPCFDVHEPPVIVMISRLSPEKFCDLGVRAFGRARAQSEARLVIVGDGPERPRLEQLVAGLDLSASVTFRGHLERPQVAAELRQADIYCHPSVLDASPTTVLEAMASGKPTVCTATGGHAEWITSGAGIAVPAREPEQLVAGLADAMRTLLRTPARRVELGRAAVATIKARFEWPAKIDVMLPVYAALCGHRDPASPASAGGSTDAHAPRRARSPRATQETLRV